MCKSPLRKGKPVERQRRKGTGLPIHRIARPPDRLSGQIACSDLLALDGCQTVAHVAVESSSLNRRYN